MWGYIYIFKSRTILILYSTKKEKLRLIIYFLKCSSILQHTSNSLLASTHWQWHMHMTTLGRRPSTLSLSWMWWCNKNCRLVLQKKKKSTQTTKIILYFKETDRESWTVSVPRIIFTDFPRLPLTFTPPSLLFRLMSTQSRVLIVAIQNNRLPLAECIVEFRDKKCERVQGSADDGSDLEKNICQYICYSK